MNLKLILYVYMLSYLYMYIRAQNQLNTLNLPFDTPCSLPVIHLLALISEFILSSFQH